MTTIPTVTATDTDAATGLHYLDAAVADPVPKWSSLETYAFMDAVARLGSRLPPPLVEKIQARLAASFTADFGFTDNHMLQFRTARYLFGTPFTEAQFVSIFGLVIVALFWRILSQREAKMQVHVEALPSAPETEAPINI